MTEKETFPSLTGLRFVLALWISVYHLIKLYGPPSLAHEWFVELGNARVDIFFCLSGFVLAHVYAQGSRFDYRSFLVARAARLYPLHLLGLSVLLAAVVAAFAMGRQEEAAAYTPLGLIANLLMLQAWGVPGAAQWNFPTWTLSAETFAYVLFPLFIAVGARLKRRPEVMILIALALTGLGDLLWMLFSPSPLAAASQVLGVARGALVFSVGFSARALFGEARLSPLQAASVAFSGALLAGAAAVQHWPLFVIAAGGAALIVGLAAIDHAGVKTPLASPVMQTLGNWSYALFVLHVPTYIILTRVFSKLGWSGQLGWVSGGVMVAVALAASWPAHVLLEEPVRHAIRRTFGARRPKPIAAAQAANLG